MLLNCEIVKKIILNKWTKKLKVWLIMIDGYSIGNTPNIITPEFTRKHSNKGSVAIRSNDCSFVSGKSFATFHGIFEASAENAYISKLWPDR